MMKMKMKIGNSSQMMKIVRMTTTKGMNKKYTPQPSFSLVVGWSSLILSGGFAPDRR
jgi:hypothetical protein